MVKAPASIPDPCWEAQRIVVRAGQAQALWIETEYQGKKRTVERTFKLTD